MATSNSDKEKLEKGGIAKKYWKIRSKEGVVLEFFPIFEVNQESGDTEATKIQMQFVDDKGKKTLATFNYLDIYMFMYFTANEELRQSLSARHEKQTNYIPYDVQLKLTDQEKSQGYANRRVELPIDELTMAIARNEAWKLWFRAKTKHDPRAFLFKNSKK